METFSTLLAICGRNSPVPAQRPVRRSFDVFFDICLNKRLSKQSWGWWFEMLSRPLWRHCNDFFSKYQRQGSLLWFPKADPCFTLGLAVMYTMLCDWILFTLRLNNWKKKFSQLHSAKHCLQEGSPLLHIYCDSLRCWLSILWSCRISSLADSLIGGSSQR